MTRIATLELHKDEFSFSAGHFTIFSATNRENLHGHNYNVSAIFDVMLHNNGMAFDYRVYKDKLLQLCAELDRRFMLPAYSKHLRLEESADMIIAHFNQEKIPFLKRDAVILPVCNVTIEELSHWFLQKLLENQQEITAHQISAITIKVFNGPGQSGAANWKEEQLDKKSFVEKCLAN